MSAFQVRMVGSPGLLFVLVVEYGRQMWSRRKLRKTSRCRSCMKEMDVGEIAWADATGCAMNRHHRYCDPCVQREVEKCRKRAGRSGTEPSPS